MFKHPIFPQNFHHWSSDWPSRVSSHLYQSIFWISPRGIDKNALTPDLFQCFVLNFSHTCITGIGFLVEFFFFFQYILEKYKDFAQKVPEYIIYYCHSSMHSAHTQWNDITFGLIFPQIHFHYSRSELYKVKHKHGNTYSRVLVYYIWNMLRFWLFQHWFWRHSINTCGILLIRKTTSVFFLLCIFILIRSSFDFQGSLLLSRRPVWVLYSITWSGFFQN